METNETSRLAEIIAQKISRIKEIGRKKVALRNKLDEVNLEANDLATQLNRLEDEVKSLKYEISECLSDHSLKLIVSGE